MNKLAIVAVSSLVLQACASDIWEAAATGMCIAAEADCYKSCRRDYKEGYADNFAYQSCVASCNGGGAGCAFTAK